MPGFLVDTDQIVLHLGGSAETRALLRRLRPQGIGVSAVTHAEVLEGSIRDPDRAPVYANLLRTIGIIPFGAEEAAVAARVRHQLRSAGLRVRNRGLDLLIAATAIAHGLTLVTGNTGDFSDVEGLSLFEDW